MTREDRLWSMTARTLQEVGEKAGVKITNSDIKKGKAVIIKKILEAEAKQPKEPVETPPVKKEIKTQKDFLNAVSDVLDGKDPKTFIKPGKSSKPVKAPNSSIKAPETNKPNKTTKEPKKANMKLSELTYKGKTKTIREWAAEIGMPWPTLYDRVNRNGWPIDLAIETPLGQRRPKS